MRLVALGGFGIFEWVGICYMLCGGIRQLFKYTGSLMRVRASFSNPNEKEGELRFDEEQIKRKMQEIQERKGPKGKEQKIEFMTNLGNSQAARRVRKYRQSSRTQNLFHFTDPTLEEKPTTLQVTGYSQSLIEIDNMPYPPCLIVFPKQTLVWEVTGVESLVADDFLILKYILPRPSYVIVGVTNPEAFPYALKAEMTAKFGNFDVLQMFEATSQFNITANDDINCVAFLISK